MKLSVIIPTLNEADNIQQTLQTLIEKANDKPFEILIIDCGSSDDTLELANSFAEVVTVSNPRLAGKKWSSLRLGANLAQGDVLLFLDADTLVPQGYDTAISKALEHQKVVGGAFEFSFDKWSPALFCVTLVNRVRYRFRKRFYGDQGIFVRKNAYLEAGGWPSRSLMEAAYLCKNLQKHGKMRLLKESVITSSRRFTEGGVWRVFFHDIKIWGMDLVGMDVEKYAAAYWQKNKDKGDKEIFRETA